MKTFIVLLLVCATLAHDSSESESSESGEEENGMMVVPREQGLCLGPEMMVAVCTADTEIGMKFTEAHKKCSADGGAAVESRRRKGKRGKKAKKSKGKKKGSKEDSHEGHKCEANFDKVLGFFEDFWFNQSCILKEMGWVNEQNKTNEDMVTDDLASLPEFIKVGMNDTKSLCRARAENASIENIFGGNQFPEETVIQNRKGKGSKESDSSSSSSSSSSEEECTPEFDESELVELEDILQKLAFFRCIHENFMEACGNYILGQIYGLMEPAEQVSVRMSLPAAISSSRASKLIR